MAICLNKHCGNYENDCPAFTVCAAYVPRITNADHIRSMTDEELAELLESLSACSRCRRYGNNCFPVWDALDWLKQPYKEATP